MFGCFDAAAVQYLTSFIHNADNSVGTADINAYYIGFLHDLFNLNVESLMNDSF